MGEYKMTKDQMRANSLRAIRQDLANVQEIISLIGEGDQFSIELFRSQGGDRHYDSVSDLFTQKDIYDLLKAKEANLRREEKAIANA